MAALVKSLKEGTADLNKITIAEWLQASFLLLYHGELVDIDQKIVYGGNVFNLHACLMSVNPAAESLEQLRKKQ